MQKLHENNSGRNSKHAEGQGRQNPIICQELVPFDFHCCLVNGNKLPALLIHEKLKLMHLFLQIHLFNLNVKSYFLNCWLFNKDLFIKHPKAS